MKSEIFKTIFKNGSRTYFYSSIFFPEKIKNDVFILYSFVRTVDDFVDTLPQKKEKYTEFKQEFYKAFKRKSTKNYLVSSFVDLMDRKKIPIRYVKAFFASMEKDLQSKQYRKLSDTLGYMYGSAEVIGLMMAKILELPKKSLAGARMLGRAMQYVNFIRDIDEDVALGRCYFPEEHLRSFGLASLDIQKEKNVVALERCIQQQIDLASLWMQEAQQAFVFLPFRYRIPIQTASEMYLWTLQCIEKNPLIVYSKKMKPSILRILYTILKNTLLLKVKSVWEKWETFKK